MTKATMEIYRMRCLVLQIMRQNHAPQHIIIKAEHDAETAKQELDNDNANSSS